MKKEGFTMTKKGAPLSFPGRQRNEEYKKNKISFTSDRAYHELLELYFFQGTGQG